MRVGVALNFNANLLVVTDYIIINFCSITGARNKYSTSFILWNQIKPDMGSTLSVHLWVNRNSKLFILEKIILHYFRKAVLNLNTVLAFGNLVIYEITDITKECHYSWMAAINYIVVFDRTAEWSI